MAVRVVRDGFPNGEVPLDLLLDDEEDARRWCATLRDYVAQEWILRRKKACSKMDVVVKVYLDVGLNGPHG